MIRFAPVALLVLIAGCAYQPVVDMKDVKDDRYQVDLAECRDYAEEQSPAAEAAGGAVAGALAGATLGAVIGAIFGDPAGGAFAGAASGGVSGAMSGGASGVEAQRQIVRNCLTGRGYFVLR